MTKRRLPVLVERSVGQVQTLRQTLASQFEGAVTSEAKHAGLSVTCAPGCASCCYHPISISVLEAIPIYRYLVRHRKWTTELRKRLQETAEKQLSVTYEVWLLSLIPCPLLGEDKRCTAYDERPLACRTMVSVGDPYYCHPHRMGDQTEVVPRDGTMLKFQEAEAKVLRKNQIQVRQVPIGQALLLAERVCNGDLDISSVDAEILKEYAEHG